MSNIVQDIYQRGKKLNKTFEQMSLILIVLGFGVLILTYINKSNTLATDNSLASFKCALTPLGQETVLDKSDLQTNLDLSMINYDTEVYKGSAVKNDIPALVNPTMVPIVSVAGCIPDSSQVVVVQEQSEVRIYPRMILNYHVAINDVIADLPILVSYSPLSGHYQVYSRKVKTEPVVFGVSGYLYKNSDLLFDTRTESLWSQYTGKAIVGTMIGATLVKHPFQVMSFLEARSYYPQALITSFVTGYNRQYNVDPFAGYLLDQDIIGPVLYTSAELGSKSTVLGFTYNNKSFALPMPTSIISDNVPLNLGDNVTFYYNRKSAITQISDSKNNIIPFDYSLWFVWKDFNPETKVIKTN